MLPENQKVDLGHEERVDRYLRRADDGLAADVKRGVHEHGNAGEVAESLE